MNNIDIDITGIFTEVWGGFNLVITWLRNHYIVLGSLRVSLFDLQIALLVLCIILSNLPIFEDTEDDE